MQHSPPGAIFFACNKKQMTAKKKKKKNALVKQVKSSVDIYENLAPLNKKLCWRIRPQTAEKGYQSALHKEGNMFVMEATGDYLDRMRRRS